MTRLAFRPAAFAAVARRDLSRLWVWALFLGLGQLVLCALLRVEESGVTSSTPSGALAAMGIFLFFAVPVGLTLFTVVLAQQDIASDTRHDWLVRPIAPLEIVGAKLAVLAAVIAVPTVLGHMAYGAQHGLAPAQALAPTWPLLTWYLLAFLIAWLTRSLMQAVLAFFLGTGLLLLVFLGVMVVSASLGFGGDAYIGRSGPPPADEWVNDLLALGALFIVSAFSLWLLIARRRIGLARLAACAYILPMIALNPTWVQLPGSTAVEETAARQDANPPPPAP